MFLTGLAVVVIQMEFNYVSIIKVQDKILVGIHCNINHR